MLRSLRNLLAGVFAATLVILILATASAYTLSRARLIAVAQAALAEGELPFDTHRDEDYFTECSMLTMLYLRNDSVWLDVIETRFTSQLGHPCEDLRVLLGSAGRFESNPLKPRPYVNYPFGSRYLEAFDPELCRARHRETAVRVAVVRVGVRSPFRAPGVILRAPP